MAQMVKNPPAVQETRTWSLGWEDLLEEEMSTHYRILAGESPWTEDPGGLQSVGLQRVGHDWTAKYEKETPSEHANVKPSFSKVSNPSQIGDKWTQGVTELKWVQEPEDQILFS